MNAGLHSPGAAGIQEAVATDRGTGAEPGVGGAMDRPPRRLRSCSSRRVLGRRVPVAATPLSRLLGLAFLDRPCAGEGLLLTRCRAVHTFGMRFALDLVFLDRQGLPVRVEHGVGRGRLLGCRRARSVLELPSRSTAAPVAATRGG
jgi:uncharacterized protein